jgi:2-polyprenyl-3-methyl-5-hydroxy-6-metoxy-1,4-benzoquinol methylase
MKRWEHLFLAFMFTLIVALIIAILFWKPTTCWDKYVTEIEAIQNCEQHNV